MLISTITTLLILLCSTKHSDQKFHKKIYYVKALPSTRKYPTIRTPPTSLPFDQTENLKDKFAEILTIFQKPTIKELQLVWNSTQNSPTIYTLDNKYVLTFDFHNIDVYLIQSDEYPTRIQYEFSNQTLKINYPRKLFICTGNIVGFGMKAIPITVFYKANVEITSHKGAKPNVEFYNEQIETLISPNENNNVDENIVDFKSSYQSIIRKETLKISQPLIVHLISTIPHPPRSLLNTQPFFCHVKANTSTDSTLDQVFIKGLWNFRTLDVTYHSDAIITLHIDHVQCHVKRNYLNVKVQEIHEIDNLEITADVEKKQVTISSKNDKLPASQSTDQITRAILQIVTGAVSS